MPNLFEETPEKAQQPLPERQFKVTPDQSGENFYAPDAPVDISHLYQPYENSNFDESLQTRQHFPQDPNRRPQVDLSQLGSYDPSLDPKPSPRMNEFDETQPSTLGMSRRRKTRTLQEHTNRRINALRPQPEPELSVDEDPLEYINRNPKMIGNLSNPEPMVAQPGGNFPQPEPQPQVQPPVQPQGRNLINRDQDTGARGYNPFDQAQVAGGRLLAETGHDYNPQVEGEPNQDILPASINGFQRFRDNVKSKFQQGLSKARELGNLALDFFRRKPQRENEPELEEFDTRSLGANKNRDYSALLDVYRNAENTPYGAQEEMFRQPTSDIGQVKEYFNEIIDNPRYFEPQEVEDAKRFVDMMNRMEYQEGRNGSRDYTKRGRNLVNPLNVEDEDIFEVLKDYEEQLEQVMKNGYDVNNPESHSPEDLLETVNTLRKRIGDEPIPESTLNQVNTIDRPREHKYRDEVLPKWARETNLRETREIGPLDRFNRELSMRRKDADEEYRRNLEYLRHARNIERNRELSDLPRNEAKHDPQFQSKLSDALLNRDANLLERHFRNTLQQQDYDTQRRLEEQIAMLNRVRDWQKQRRERGRRGGA